MRQGLCCECGMSSNIRSFYLLNGQMYCEPCVWKASREAKEKGHPSEYVPLTDNSVCARCGASSDSSDFQLVGNQPLCPSCGQLVQDWPYPTWLKAGLAFVLVLLVIALINGRKYFHAGRSLYVGERLVDEGHFEQALPYLEESVRVAPASDKGVLLAARAALMTGRVDIADKVLHGHNGGHFEDPGEDYRTVEALWNQANRSFEKAEQAAKLEAQGGHAAEAARLMHEAAASYPQAANLSIAAEMYDEGAAFERRDYDTFLSIAQKQWKMWPGPETASVVASALACKYAVTGDPEYKKQSEDMLQEAERGSRQPDQKKSFAEYSERIRYRLASREIIDKPEYDRKFRSGKAQ
jgi:tetratricopeptide (TPR) repeat protein